jgi:hypothetical protein
MSAGRVLPGCLAFCERTETTCSFANLDRLIGRQQPVAGFVEHDAVRQLGERRRSAHCGQHLVLIPAPAKVPDPIEARIDPIKFELVDRRTTFEHVELDAGLLSLKAHRHVAALPLERAGRGFKGKGKAELFHRLSERCFHRQLAAEEHVDFHRHGRDLRHD